ncbi:hypothetical protein AMAG_02376 [Allomyces macrogynus ATCC 38327]|uniref:Pre-mRNA-splicing factor n=1 Tax=Allomyces macrogynus (strain ATCC 38327) TaxID=578462 RepID=A0A0L0S2F9_ALLM3|nr:hypothetical protein AMAG_02376 [Allomyces macrogynus ATCC 38327]|eukprot:KNE56581.1 hypothetical protein AMAG_02376 [Allomyces macrogynus ATCC 38327]
MTVSKTQQEQDFRQTWTAWCDESCTEPIQVAVRALTYQRSRGMAALWALSKPEDQFARLFTNLARLAVAKDQPWGKRGQALQFLCLCFQSIEIDMVRKEILRFVSISIWSNLSSDALRQKNLAKSPNLQKLWKSAQKKLTKATGADRDRLIFQQSWLTTLVLELHGMIASSTAAPTPEQASFLAQLLQLLIEIENQLPTRRFAHALFMDYGVLALCESATVADQAVQNWLAMLRVFLLFQVDEHTGQVLTKEEMEDRIEDELVAFQDLVYAQFKGQLMDLAMAHLGQLQDAAFLEEHLANVPTDVLLQLMHALTLRTTDMVTATTLSHGALVTVLVAHLAKHANPLADLAAVPLYPVTATSIADRVVPPLSLQYLSLSDYLFRHYALYRKESAYAITVDVDEAVQRLRPVFDADRELLEFRGRSRMALAPDTVILTHVGRMAAFDAAPTRVELEVKYTVGMYRREIAREWDSTSKGEVVFLAAVVPQKNGGFRVSHIRAGVVDALLAYDGLSLHADRIERRDRNKAMPFSPAQADHRTLRILMDRHQYHLDAKAQAGQSEDAIYGTLNVLVRRDRRENNFWAVLDCIRECYLHNTALPMWLADVYLGYGDPRSVHYSHFDANKTIYFHDTFLTMEHLLASFPGKTIHYDGDRTDRLTLRFDGPNDIYVTRHEQAPAGPFQATLAPENKIPFTPTQVDAICAGSSDGLTLLVGPPGTGKTDVAVQVLCNLYHARPGERILLLTHSNQALNQLFEKLMNLNHIPERHLLRLGHADDERIGEYDQYGRVTHFMTRRAALLEQVQILATSLQVPGDHAFSCETAAAFFKVHIDPRWAAYERAPKATTADVAAAFPFLAFFQHLHETTTGTTVPLIAPDATPDKAQEIVAGCWTHLQAVRKDVEQSRAFEVLKTDRDKANLLLAREARIVAMTTTYAALKRRDLLDVGFTFESLLMEEAGTVLEIETYIPLSLSPSLKRVVLIGDHHQLPPVVQCPDLAHVAESLFVRLLRLGVPPVILDRQGRSRKVICDLYRHVYPGLDHLPVVEAMDVYANPGFQHVFQFLHLAETEEAQPVAHYFQNLGEAEAVVALYQVMRLLGYPSEKITILTTYNGQRALIKEVMSQRCAANPALFGTCHVTTVDKYQGQQNDYVLVSLVRTKSAGHVADVRRLVVAMSRARLGLYIVGRFDLFSKVPEMRTTLDLLAAKPTDAWQLVPSERYVSESVRAAEEVAPEEKVVKVANVAQITELVANLAQEIELEQMDMDME